MCGIFASTDPNVIRNSERISAVLARRGTERVEWLQGVNGYVYAHVPLALRGKKKVRQPIVDREGVFLFAGELWDTSKNENDTLVFLERLRLKGLRRTVKSTRGTWAFIYWSARSKTLVFSTDRFGEEPLHYASVNEHVYVASEIKILIAAGVPLRNICHVEPGREYSFNKRLRIKEILHWASKNQWRSFDPAKLRSRIAIAIAECTHRADLQSIGLLVSGGIDSTIVAFEAARLGIRRAWTIAVEANSIDAVRAQMLAERLNLDWTLILAQPAPPEVGIVTGEVSNRSIVEELCMYVVLARELAHEGIQVVLTGTGADEVFVGYGHLMRRVHATLLQERFISTHYRYDLRASNKLFMGYGVKTRNPFLSRRVAEYALYMHASLLLGPGRILKWPLRFAYADVLGSVVKEPKLVARETMGVKRIFRERFGNSPYAYRKIWRRVLENPLETAKWIWEADHFSGIHEVRTLFFQRDKK